MAITKLKEDEKPKTEQAAPSTEVATVAAKTDVSALFARHVNGANKVKSLSLKRTLTKPLIAMAHLKQLLFTCKSEMYIMSLPAKGRGAAPTQARVIDGIDVETAEECTLVVNEMMAGAFQRGGFKVLVSKKDDKDESILVGVDGTSLIGHSFAFKTGNINEDKGYRHIDTVEVTVET